MPMTDTRSARAQFVRFAIIGTLGFVVDVGVLYGALALGASPMGGRVLSFLAAASFTWLANRHCTFSATASPWREWRYYVASMAAGLAVNFLVYALVLELLPPAWWTPGLAVACGSLAGLGINFTSAKRFVFKS